MNRSKTWTTHRKVKIEILHIRIFNKNIYKIKNEEIIRIRKKSISDYCKKEKNWVKYLLKSKCLLRNVLEGTV